MLISFIVNVCTTLGALFVPNKIGEAKVETSIEILDNGRAFHGYIFSPPSRAYLCLTEENLNCGSAKHEPQSIECQKNFPINGPSDGNIASCGIYRFRRLDEIGSRRWVQVNLVDYIRVTHDSNNNVLYTLELDWFYTAKHVTEKYELFASKKNYNPNTMPLARRYLTRIGTIYTTETLNKVMFSFSDMSTFDVKGGVLLAIWSIGDTSRAFYQVIDYKINFGTNKTNPEEKAILRKAVVQSIVSTHSQQGICPRLDRKRCVNIQYVINPCNCHEYYYCTSVTNIITMNCPADLVYDEELGVCNWRASTILPSDVTCV